MKMDRFYPIFDDPIWLERALPLGVKLVQMRIKDQDPDQIMAMLARSRDLCRKAGAVLVVNDHWQQAIALGCEFVHLGQEDLDDADIGAIRKAGMRLGLSTHDEDELERALSFDPDYVALGPVWPTILKKMKWHAQGLDRVRQWKKRIGDVPLVAIGGMNTDRAALAFDAGADMVAAVTDITLHPDPDTRIREWLGITR